MNYLKLSILYILIILFSFSNPSYSAYPPSQEKSVVNAVKKAKPSVVKIKTTSKDGRTGGGSGIVLTQDGFILTNEHVVRNASTIQVILVNGKTFSAVISGTSASKDLAVIKVKASNLPVPKFGDSSKLELGQTAIAIGNPLQFQWTVTVGCISALNRDIQRKDLTYRNMIQTDTAINSGSSGGALINLNGEVIGVNTVVYRAKNAQGLSFAIPINIALEASKYLRKGEIQNSPKPWIGIGVKTITKEIAENYDLPVRNGVYVETVIDYGPAKKAGIEQGCLITNFNGQRILSTDDFGAMLNGCVPGQSIELTVWKHGKKTTINVLVEHKSH